MGAEKTGSRRRNHQVGAGLSPRFGSSGESKQLQGSTLPGSSLHHLWQSQPVPSANPALESITVQRPKELGHFAARPDPLIGGVVLQMQSSKRSSAVVVLPAKPSPAGRSRSVSPGSGDSKSLPDMASSKSSSPSSGRWGMRQGNSSSRRHRYQLHGRIRGQAGYHTRVSQHRSHSHETV